MKLSDAVGMGVPVLKSMENAYHCRPIGAPVEIPQKDMRTGLDFVPCGGYVVSALHGPDVPIV